MKLWELIERVNLARGNWGHKGRPGKRGGSAPSKGGGAVSKTSVGWSNKYGNSRAVLKTPSGDNLDIKISWDKPGDTKSTWSGEARFLTSTYKKSGGFDVPSKPSREEAKAAAVSLAQEKYPEFMSDAQSSYSGK